MTRMVKYQAGRSFLDVHPDTINGIEEYIRWAELEVPQQMTYWLDQLVFYMALINQGIAREMSYGPLDPYGKNSDAAWKIPVRRISQRYYLGWKVRQLRPGVWQLYNDSREAYFIEFGISEVGWGDARYVPARRIRRPVRKLSLRKTLERMMATQAYHRVWVNIYANPRKRHRGRGFTQIVQSPAMGSFMGPMLGRRIP